MTIRMGSTAIVVGDCDEAVEYYTKKLGFTLTEDRHIDKRTRIVVVARQNNLEAAITIIEKDSCEKFGKLGLHASSSAPRIIETEDVRQAYAILKAKGVNFTGEPTVMPYGLEVSFEDPYGNEFDLVEISC